MIPCRWHGPIADLQHAQLGATVQPLWPALAGRRGLALLDARLLRRRGSIDLVIVTDRAVLAIKGGDSRVAAEDAALDLAEFHSSCRDVPVLPILLRPRGSPVPPQLPLPLAGAAPVVETTPLLFAALLAQIDRFPPLGRDPAAWIDGAYAPVPGLLDAACMLYAAHDVAALRLAAAGPAALGAAAAAIRAAIEAARAADGKTIVFVTGAPGAGKTLCGLDLAFAPGAEAVFLTGNPTLVHVLRESLARDAADRGMDRRAARRRVDAIVGALPHWRDRYAAGGVPPESILVIDEAQRCWTAPHAIHATRKRTVPLTGSEACHVLSALERRPGFAVIVCLLGGGQEIYDGEGGLQAWGEALRDHPTWRVVAPDHAPADLRQRLPDDIPAERRAGLHLALPIRAVRAPRIGAWVDAMLGDAPSDAAALARAGLPFRLTRSLDAMRLALRSRGSRTAALLASSTARRLRAEGLGATLPHQDDEAVAHWFLQRWPDIRSSDALEVVGTEFAVQGLEFDRAGLCWDLDLIRGPAGWLARRFRATAWTRANEAATRNRLNAYRVLLTRARHGTIIWIPRGDRRDSTRDPAQLDAVAAYLRACGVAALDDDHGTEQDAPALSEPALL